VTRVVLVPGVLALLPEYAGLEDPVAELRAACLSAVAWLGPGPVAILADPQGQRVATSLLEACGGFETGASAPSSTTAAAYLVVGNGSACRSEKAPGHLDERAHAFDAELGAALSSSDANWPSFDLGDDLLASLDGIGRLRELLPTSYEAVVDYDDDPFGVQYWVLRWQW
jgi:hypothetical protein